MALQQRLAPQVIKEGGPENVRFICATDVAFADRPPGRRPSLARAAAVVLSYPGLEVAESHVAEQPVAFPYVPGLLSFREIPALSHVLAEVRQPPGLVLVDGHGYSHPRRLGIASHLGLLLDVPTIGCAKSRLTGEHSPPGLERGARTPLMDGGEVIGLVLRTREAVAPVYVSTGHRIGLEEAAEWVLRLCRGYRLPAPIRLADQLSKGRSLSPPAKLAAD